MCVLVVKTGIEVLRQKSKSKASPRAPGKEKKNKHRKGRSSGKAPRGSDGQAGALGRDQLRDRRMRDMKH